jgi:kinase-associated protein B
MQETTLQMGDRVIASYKSGEYVGEIVELRNGGKAAVQVLAVVKHPDQGDLHHPMNPDVPFFHQRKALAYREIALMLRASIRKYEGPIPDYKLSLLQSIDREMAGLDQTRRWIDKSLQELAALRTEYDTGEPS